MSKRTFLRYYGYWYIEQLNEERRIEWEEHKNKLKENSRQNREALGIRN